MIYRNNKILIISTVILGVLLMMTNVWGFSISNPRALGMGGAYTAVARNFESVSWNPANLGLKDNGKFSINFFNLGAGINNNSFSLSDFNKYNGSILTDNDKDDILSNVPADGLMLNLIAEASALNLSAGRIAFSSRGYALSTINLDRDPFALLLYGNIYQKELEASDTRGEGYGVIDFALSMGQPVKSWDNGEMAIGASLHYLKGLAYHKVVDSDGILAFEETGVEGAGFLTMRTALGGWGYAGDLGISVRFEDKYQFSAAWLNTFGKMFWNHETEEMYFDFEIQPITAQDIIDSVGTDSLINSTDTTLAVEPFVSDLPSIIRLGFARQTERFTWSIDWIQSLKTRPGYNVNPILSTGIEYKFVSFMPVRLGFSTGSNQGTLYSIGTGFIAGALKVDFAWANSGSPIPADTKGAKFSFGIGLYF